MIYLALPRPAQPRRLPFFLAMEEWVAHTLPSGEYFFVWQQSVPTIICGRNQCIPAEVDVPGARECGVDIVRRRSGGGAVVADGGNLMLSYVGPRNEGKEISAIFSAWTTTLAQALSDLGLKAEASGRNDICIHGRKVSGGAFYALPGRAIAHSTLLYEMPQPELLKHLTPARAKFESKGVKSVEARITSLKAEGLAISQDELISHLHDRLCSDTLTLTDEDVHAIENIEKSYYNPSFLKLDEDSRRRRTILIPGRGILSASYGAPGKIRLSGDFLDAESIAALELAIESIPAFGSIGHKTLDPKLEIHGVTAAQLQELLSSEP
ncbi:MAG: hypothetical protein K2L96_05075 [Muribaculaceae bacterium]|nr:hypothetical protein [Muribaculaceae bacterium]